MYQTRIDRLERDREVIDASNTIMAKRSRWGFWKYSDRLRLGGRPFNYKRVHRVYCEMKLNMKRRTKKSVTTWPAKHLGYIQAVNRTWMLDFMRDTPYDGQPFRTS